MSLVPLLLALSLGRIDSPVTDRAEQLGQQALLWGASPRGAAPLIRLHQLFNEVDDLNLLAQPYAVLLSRRNTEPGVRALARIFFADVERARGKSAKAVELLEPMGFLQDFWVVGGFDNEGKSGCNTDFGPESKTDVSLGYPARTSEAKWVKLPGHAPDGYVDLSTLVQPNHETVAYALSWLETSQEMSVNLGIGTSGAFRLFLNGVKVATSDRYNLPRLDQTRVKVRLRKGKNRLLLKVCQEAGPLGFFLRQEHLEAFAHPALYDSVPGLEKGPFPQPQPLPTLTDSLDRLVKLSNDPAMRADYATVLDFTQAFEEKQHTAAVEAEKAAATARTDLQTQLTAARLWSFEPNQQLRFLEAATAVAPASPWPKLGLAQHALAQERPHEALAMLDVVLKTWPRLAPARVLRAQALEASGQRVAAAQEAESAFAELPHIPSIAREAVNTARGMGRLDEAIARGRMLLSLRFADVNARRILASGLIDAGKIDDAGQQLERVLALDPYDNGSRLKWAELLAANGKAAEAAQLFAQARAFAPLDADLLEREGRALLQLGKKSEAIAAFTRALALKPQNPSLKEALRTLQGEDSAVGAKYAKSVNTLLPLAAQVAGEDAVYLSDLSAIRVQASGQSSRFSQVVVKVFNDRGVEAFRQMPITYSPDRQEVRVLKARVYKPDGSIIESYSESEQAMNEPWSGMYYDARARVISFPELSPGDVLEMQWRLEDTAKDNLLSDYYGDIDSVQSTVAKLNYQYTVEMPKGRTLYWNKASLPSWVTPSLTTEGDRTVYQFVAKNVARVVPEPQLPGWAEVGAQLHVSTYQTWNDVGRYWWGLVREQLIPNEELKKTVDEALKGVDRRDTAKVTRTLYDWVVTHTRYVALEFGIHGYKPYRVTQVLSRKFGDCKDKASLMVAMLKEGGVDARLVLLRMRHLGTLSGEPASLSAFNHAIAYVPKLDLYLDGTAEFYGSQELPLADRVANVLVVEPGGESRFLTTAEAKADDNTTSLNLSVTLHTDGSSELTGSQTVVGQSAPELRRNYQAESSRKAVFEQAWGQAMPGLVASKVAVNDLTHLEEPVKLTFAFMAPRYAEALPGVLRFFPFGAGRAFTQALAPLSERKHDVVFPAPWKNVFAARYALPTGYVADAPWELSEESPFGRARISASVEAGQLSCVGEMTLSSTRIAVKDYPAFREWLLKVDQAFSRKVSVKRLSGETALR